MHVYNQKLYFYSLKKEVSNGKKREIQTEPEGSMKTPVLVLTSECLETSLERKKPLAANCHPYFLKVNHFNLKSSQVCSFSFIFLRTFCLHFSL